MMAQPMLMQQPPMTVQAPSAAPQKRSSVFWGVLLALIVFFIVIPIGGVITCVFCAGAGAGIGGARLKSQIATTETACNTIRMATVLYQSTHPGGACPSVAQLKADKLLEQSFSVTDSWGAEYKILCAKDDILCMSAGPDGKWDTADDIREPPAEAQAVALQVQIEDSKAKEAKLQAQLANEKDPAEVAALQAMLDAEKAHITQLQQQANSPSGSGKPCNCTPGDPLCSCL